MIDRNTKVVKVFSEYVAKKGNLNRTNISQEDLDKAYKFISDLAKNPSPENRYIMNQVIAVTVDAVYGEKTQYLDLIADVRQFGEDETMKFRIKTQKPVAYYQAKGSTTLRSRTGYRYATLETDEISVRPYVEYKELASGKVDFAELINDAADAMEDVMIQKFETVIKDYFDNSGSPNYASGSGVTGAFDTIVDNVLRVTGTANIIGDIAALNKISGLIVNPSDRMVEEFHRNGFIGVYRGANVIKLNNPYITNDMSKTLLHKGYIYVVPGGSKEIRPVKVGYQGVARSYEQMVIDDETYELLIRKDVGIAIVGDQVPCGLYVDTSLDS